MSTFFVDSSALGRRYLAEVGSAWVLSWITKASGQVIIVCDLAPIELFSTFARLQRESRLPASTVTILQNAVLIDMQHEYISIALDSQILVGARTLVSRYPLPNAGCYSTGLRTQRGYHASRDHDVCER